MGSWIRVLSFSYTLSLSLSFVYDSSYCIGDSIKRERIHSSSIPRRILVVWCILCVSYLQHWFYVFYYINWYSNIQKSWSVIKILLFFRMRYLDCFIRSFSLFSLFLNQIPILSDDLMLMFIDEWTTEERIPLGLTCKKFRELDFGCGNKTIDKITIEWVRAFFFAINNSKKNSGLRKAFNSWRNVVTWKLR